MGESGGAVFPLIVSTRIKTPPRTIATKTWTGVFRASTITEETKQEQVLLHATSPDEIANDCLPYCIIFTPLPKSLFWFTLCKNIKWCPTNKMPCVSIQGYATGMYMMAIWQDGSSYWHWRLRKMTINIDEVLSRRLMDWFPNIITTVLRV